MKATALSPTLFIAALLAGCGQGGDLYLPTDPAAQPQPPATAPASTPEPAPTQEQKKEQK